METKSNGLFKEDNVRLRNRWIHILDTYDPTKAYGIEVITDEAGTSTEYCSHVSNLELVISNTGAHLNYWYVLGGFSKVASTTLQSVKDMYEIKEERSSLFKDL